MAHLIMIGGSLPSLSFTAVSTSNAGGSSINFGSQSIGPAQGDRVIIATLGIVFPGGLVLVPSLTVNGVAATLQIFGTLAAAQSPGNAIFTASVPAGTTATFVASGTFSSSGGVTLGVYSATGLISSSATATDTDNVNPINLSLPIQANGIAVCAASTAIVLGSSWTWAGASEDFDTGGIPSASGASTSSATATTLSITAIPNNGGFASGVGATFR